MEYPSETADAFGVAPIRMDEPYGIIAANNPVNKIDPLELEGIEGAYPFMDNYDPYTTVGSTGSIDASYTVLGTTTSMSGQNDSYSPTAIGGA